MKTIICSDSFKGTLSAQQACDAIERGVKAVLPEAGVMKVPMADGGDGTLSVVATSTPHVKRERLVRGPLGTPVAAYYLLLENKTALIETAQAAGITLIPEPGRDPRITTSYGVGELIADALDLGCTKIVVFLGGSGTNDGGMGMVQALGVRFLDASSRLVAERQGEGYAAASLRHLSRIDCSGMHPAASKVQFIGAYDVRNTLCGPAGASFVFGPQKGATPRMVQELDALLMHYARVIDENFGITVDSIPGSGAAGGMGAGLAAFFKAQLVPGAQVVMDLVSFDRFLENSIDLLITGEGKVDNQTLFGKTVFTVAQRAQRYGIPVIAYGGCVGEGYEALYKQGIKSIIDISEGKRLDILTLSLHAGIMLERAVARTIGQLV